MAYHFCVRSTCPPWCGRVGDQRHCTIWGEREWMRMQMPMQRPRGAKGARTRTDGRTDGTSLNEMEQVGGGEVVRWWGGRVGGVLQFFWSLGQCLLTTPSFMAGGQQLWTTIFGKGTKK